MFSRIHRPLLLLLTSAVIASPNAKATISPAEEAAEAKRLYDRANDYVTRIPEDDYSYAYIQFYWLRAQSNVERVVRDYPTSEIGRKLLSKELKLGPYDLVYFRDRVLPRLEEKKVDAFEDVNCAIFLYNFRDNNDPARLQALSRIAEVLSRRERWSEALIFPVLTEHHPLLLSSIFRVAARFGQDKTIQKLFKSATTEEQKKFWPILGEALAVRGEARTAVAKFLDQHDGDDVKLAVLSGMIEREVKIQRHAALRLPPQDLVILDAGLKNKTVRDDVESVAKTFFPRPTPASIAALAGYHAALGQKPDVSAEAPTHLAYLDYLAAFEKTDELAAYPMQPSLPDEARQACKLRVIELYAQTGHVKESETARVAYAADSEASADLATLAQFRGLLKCTTNPIKVHEETFANLAIKDPCILAQAIMEWSLAPTSERRGSSPWDPVVRKYLPGFDNLPLPKSKEVQAASSSSKPY